MLNRRSNNAYQVKNQDVAIIIKVKSWVIRRIIILSTKCSYKDNELVALVTQIRGDSSSLIRLVHLYKL